MSDEEFEAPYLPPDHLRTPQTIGIVPVRTFYTLLYPTVFISPILAYLTWQATGLVLPTIAVALLPALLVSPLAAWWLHPGAEHGLIQAVSFAKRTYLPPQPQAPELVAVYRMPTLNLETAAQSVRDRARAQWARVLNALTHPVKIIVRTTPVQTLPMLEDLARHPRQEARELGAWFTDHLATSRLLDRERLLIVPASSEPELHFRCRVLEKALRHNQLEGERVSPEELPLLRTRGWNPRATQDADGPVIEEGWTEALVDGWWTRSYALGELPASLLTDWAAPLLSDDEALDVAIDVYPQSTAYTKLLISTKLNQLLTSRASVARDVAIEQLQLLAEAIERRLVKPFEMGMTLVVRDASRAAVRERSRLIEERVRGLGGKLHLLRWEQAAGVQQLDVARTRSLGRNHLVETGTVARTYPWSDGSLQVGGGVPWGVAGDRPCVFTPYVRTSRGPHMAWYGTTNAGKGTGAHMLWSRLHLVRGVRLFGIDQDEQHEHCGRFLDYLGGRKLTPRDARDAAEIVLHREDGVVILDLSEVDDEDEVGAIYAAWTEVVKRHMLRHPGQSICFVDEATRIADTEIGAKALRQNFQRARHWGQSSHALTQRPTDWFGTRVGRAVQGNCDAWWCGGQQPGEIDDVRRGLRLSVEEANLIGDAPIGEGLLVVGRRRVWLDLFDKLTPREYAAFNTDPVVVPFEARKEQVA
jgi:hypothetical protein